MRSGRLRYKITLERRTDSQDSSGQVIHSYTPFASVWAEISPVSGREFFAAQQIQSNVNTKIRIRWRSDIDETCRVAHIVVHGDSPQLVDYYDINAVLPDEKTNRREILLMCTKRTAEGWRD